MYVFLLIYLSKCENGEESFGEEVAKAILEEYL